MRLAKGSKEMVPIEDSLLDDQDLVPEIQDIMASTDCLYFMDQEQEMAKTIGIAINPEHRRDHCNFKISQDALDVSVVIAIKLNESAKR